MSSIPDNPAKARVPILLLVMASAVGPLSLNIFVPSMPGLAEYFSTNDATVQLTLTVFLVAIAVSQLFIGPLSDRFGRRRVLIGGLTLFVMASLAARLAPDIGSLITARAFQGIGGATGIVLSRAIVRDLYGRDRAASMIGYVTMGMAIAPMLGPSIGGFLDGSFGWQSSFDLIVVLGSAVFVAVILRLPETNPRAGQRVPLAAFVASHRDLAGQMLFWSYALVGAAGAAIFFSFLGGAPFITQRLMGLTPFEYGLYFALVAGGYGFGNLLSGRFAEHHGPDRMILAGNLVAIAAVAAMGLVAASGVIHPLTIFVPMSICAFSNGLVLPSALASAVSVRPDLAGAASGLAGALQMGTGALASAIVGALIHHGLFALVAMMAVAALLSAVAGHVARTLSRADAERLLRSHV
ncbi:MAG: multidrug effflux MFS transporter [Hyphomicrobiaceae bacterium]|nr:multidrug effflux MFS transporter [Hyphomicrobiaceae bacterium]